MNTLLRMEGITKIYPGVVANQAITLDVAEGEVHALLGENGAGKSTLMNILYGMTTPDHGRILWRGQPVRIASPRDAMRVGIGLVHQHFMLAPRFTALQNIVLGEHGVSPWSDVRRELGPIRQLADRYGLDIDLEAETQDMPLGMRQRVEILKALYRGAHLLALDEPTAVLTPAEADKLFEILRRLTAQGHAIIFISHKLEEVLGLSDRITVLRDGQNVQTLPAAGASKSQLANLMVGRPVVLEVNRRAAGEPGPLVMQIDDLALEREHGRDQLHGVSLQVRAGEILGLAGIDGNGQRALLEALCGLTRPTRGQVRVLDHDLTRASPRQVAAWGVGRIPEDRSTMGLLLQLSIQENLALENYYRPPMSRWGILQRGHMAAEARRLVKEFSIRTSGVHVLVEALSGGNQQKVILARELSAQPRALVVANATRGLDVGATEYTYQRLVERRDQGAGILLISSDLEEILCLSDRIAVLHNGRIMGVMPAAQASRAQLGLMMTGTPLHELPAA